MTENKNSELVQKGDNSKIYRKIFTMEKYGMPSKEIAEQIGANRSTVDRLKHCEKLLRADDYYGLERFQKTSGWTRANIDRVAEILGCRYPDKPEQPAEPEKEPEGEQLTMEIDTPAEPKKEPEEPAKAEQETMTAEEYRKAMLKTMKGIEAALWALCKK